MSNLLDTIMAQMPALIPKEVEIQRLKKIWLMVIALGSTVASVEVDNFVDGSLHQTETGIYTSTLVAIFPLHSFTNWLGWQQSI